MGIALQPRITGEDERYVMLKLGNMFSIPAMAAAGSRPLFHV
jgi:hypothetical protein